MRLIFVLLFVSTLCAGQRTLIKIDGHNSFEFGGQFVPMSSSQVGIWAAYNGFFRGELFVNKYTSSFSSGTEFGGRITVPVLKQSETFPINVFGDGEYTRFENSGFSSDYIYGAAIVSHRIRNGSTIISPFASAGYIRFSSSGDFKWTVGIDVQLSKILLSAEHGRIGSGGTTYLRAGIKLGKTGSAQQEISQEEPEELPFFNQGQNEETDPGQKTNATDEPGQMGADEQDKIDQGQDEPDVVRQATEDEARKLEEQEVEEERQRQEQLKKERIARDQERLEQLRAEQEAMKQRQLEQQKKEEALLEQQRLQEEERKQLELNAEKQPIREEANAIVASQEGKFGVQFFASRVSNKSFPNVDQLGTIHIEYISEQNLYRYLVGYYASRSEAEEIKGRMVQMGYTDSFVKGIE